MTTSIDVAILGGGPAGCATAIALRQLGHSCLVVERSNYAEVRVGETLPPAARRPLAALSLWDRFLDAGHLPSVAICSVWGADEPNTQDFIFNPYGNGWHLDRQQFDALLAQEAASAGVAVLREAQWLSCDSGSADRWDVEIAAGAGHHIFRAKFVVDATGRAASFARKHGAKRAVHDRLIGIVGSYRPITPQPAATETMLLEAVEMGWWYCAPLPDARVIMTLMTDGDLHAQASHDAPAHVFERSLMQTTYALTRVEGFALENSPSVVAAHSSCLAPIFGPSWLAVGDAAAAYDPLSGQGILKSLESGMLAAYAISRYLAGESTSMREYEKKVHADFDQYLALRDIYYSKETRWQDSPFWRRRHFER